MDHEHVWTPSSVYEGVDICERCGLSRRNPEFEAHRAAYGPLWPFPPNLAPTPEGQREIWRRMGILD